ncbi:MAG TPA: GPW/gp25 family protein [Puia sp.]|nr:GPW/gp25 family protein [Puia sp.]
MQLEYYSLPLAVEKVMNKGEHPKCSMQQSVIQHLHLLLTTAFGGFPADEGFGCGIWDNDFDNVTSAHKLREYIRETLHGSIETQEPRLGHVRVEVFLRQEEMPGYSVRNIKKKIDVTITGLLSLTNEKLSYRDSFFVGPLSY